MVAFFIGTPLGSLSFWGLFALFYHLLVQLAYAMTGKEDWFSEYAILGDDLVIAEVKVARKYRRLLKRLHVQISEAKSLVSMEGTCEFASRFIYRGKDLSPISFKALIVAESAASQLWSFFSRIQEFRPVCPVGLYRGCGAGYRVCARVGCSFAPLRKLPYQ